ncbi:GNAT family N-acetyltransferase [Roseateles oligotrophus]|uniref:GNAT family N-acetyltransferase n=1 Tax=Roseateles oligotrophus TaxID=1769250 RepID=A0ABT2YFC9_9BURK|nr:GNAT family N-acetyltransferase [Roseateles oligotrophus]MCV2368747.1 GNAT family N-acetyltransferase [Roseateles oligotrophus]
MLNSGKMLATATKLPMTKLAASRSAKLLYWISRAISICTNGRAIFQVYLLCAQPIKKNNLLPHPSNKTEVKKINASNPLSSQFPRNDLVNNGRFSRGHVCFAATVKESFAGHIWLAFKYYDEDEVHCKFTLPDNAQGVWDYDVYVAPNFRLTRVAKTLWDTVNKHLLENNISWTFSRISIFNPASIQSHERLGAVHIGTCSFLRWGSLQIALLPGRKLPYITLSKTQTPSIELKIPIKT